MEAMKKKRKHTLAGLAVRFCRVFPVHLTACKIKQPYVIVNYSISLSKGLRIWPQDINPILFCL
jgi:hypothetical protein